MRKGFFALLLCAALSLLPFTLSDSLQTDTVEYKGGGVVWRQPPRTKAIISELNVAYLDFDMPYIVTGEQAEWRVNATGGDGIYEYKFFLYYTSEPNSAQFFGEAVRPASSDPVFKYTTERTGGRYMLEIEVSDSMGGKLRWQSQVFEVYSNESDDETTVAGKVRSLARECLASAGDSDYERALWLHDWLIYNANYDHRAEPNYYADGVLLHGTGVCQSYAYAYDMLLKEIGIETIYISGMAGDFSLPNPKIDYHGWNLVKMDGEWYHVDCTWDDPNSGGFENHNYFGLTDEMISGDHSWTRDEKGVLPKCVSTDNTYSIVMGTIPVNDLNSLAACFQEIASNGYTYGEFVYTGSESAFSMYNASVELLDSGILSGNGQWQLSGNKLHAVVYECGSVDLEKAQQMRFTETDISMYAGETYSLKFNTLPEGTLGAGIVWSSSNAEAADVSNGVITAKAVGTTVIGATCQSGRRYDVTVCVLPACVISVPDGVISIESEAFADCTGITAVKIPESVSYIAPDAFEGSGVKAIICRKGTYAEEYAADKGILCIISE